MDSYLLAWLLIIQYEKGLALMKMRETLHLGMTLESNFTSRDDSVKCGYIQYEKGLAL